MAELPASSRRAEQAAGLTPGALDDSSARDLPALLTSAPAAVLLVDLTDHTVQYVSPQARLLADVPLPIPVRDWSEAAGLRDPGGQQLEESSNPLISVAAGNPVNGQPLLVGATGDRSMWATGFPFLTGPDDPLMAVTPADLHTRALLVLIDLDDTAAQALTAITDEHERDATLQRSMLALDFSVAVTDPRQPDNPVIWVNEVFTRTTGYSFEEAVGRNCRFLQGSATNPARVSEVRQGIAEQRTQSVVLLNYRKDGTPFWNELSIAPVLDAAGDLVSFVGVQTDVTSRVTGDQEREALLVSERRARALSERANQRLRLQAEATRTLASSLALDDVLDRLANLLVPDLLDAVAIDVDDGHGEFRRVAVLHHTGDHRLMELTTKVGDSYVPDDGSVASRAMTSGTVQLVEPWPSSVSATRLHLEPDALSLLQELNPRAVAVLPMVARERVLGLVTAIATGTKAGGRESFDADTLSVLEELTTSAALAVENAQLYLAEHSNAMILQRSLLPPDPIIPGLELVVRYRPAGLGNEVGGDWYDAYTVADGSHALVIGDAVGHDIAAAAAMGRLRNVLHGCAFDAPNPAEALERLELSTARPEHEELIGAPDMASAFMAYLRVNGNDLAGGADLTWSNAGHPAPLLMTPDGRVSWLDDEPDPLLGVALGVKRQNYRTHLPAGSLLALFTDGLVEVRGEDITAGQARLATLLSEIGLSTDLDHAADTITGSVERPEDDVCLLLLRVPGHSASPG